jgi:biopolymer transport protein ExbD
MKKRRKKKNVINVPVASMGDIAFLLIIFFMVASHLSRERHNLEQPRSLDAIKLKETQVTVTIDVSGNYFLQGRQVYHSDDIEAGVKILLENRETEQERTVIFKCDKNITRERFIPVIEAIVKGGGLVGAVGDKGVPVGPNQNGE